ncbi:hypothetical protein IM792_07195 [Mucilaginibacter sp. JRF]|uniref:BfmA/BtgA family mobilization protein n=1 Tax=Mucilaginibacter sp. JRF TaxID=2780088 RepID=UPI001881E074|nr:BfmA/BtgA family mobilization protein [Mucilaginibacter sp. JRF]MBE9584226.1 hypothetical protein [Mucilaginibacter sp. JRF]
MNKDTNSKTIRFSVKTDEKLQAVANKCGLSKTDLLRYMADYFYKTKKDPRDLNDEQLKNAINRKTDNIVAFIRTQEQELLIPAKKDMEQMLVLQEQLTALFQKDIISHNDRQRKYFDSQSTLTDQVIRYLKQQESLQADRQKLKQRCRAILEHYIRHREQMGILNKQSDKDELAAYVRQQMDAV